MDTFSICLILNDDDNVSRDYLIHILQELGQFEEERVLKEKGYAEFKRYYLEKHVYDELNTMLDKHKFLLDNIGSIKAAIDFILQDAGDFKNTEDALPHISKESIIQQTIMTLNGIDPTGQLKETFTNGLENGTVILYEAGEEEQVKKRIEGFSSAISDWSFIEGPVCQQVQEDDTEQLIRIVIVPLKNRITDVGSIVHELVHKYCLDYFPYAYTNFIPYTNIYKADSYFEESPSIYFQKKSYDYLVENGYGDLKEEINAKMYNRLANDYLNNLHRSKENNNSSLKELIDVMEVKAREGQVTRDNIMNQEQMLKKQIEMLFSEPNNYLSEEDIRLQTAYGVLLNANTLLGRSSHRLLIQYSLGTYYAMKRNEKDMDHKIWWLCQHLYDPNFDDQELMDYLNNELSAEFLEDEGKEGLIDCNDDPAITLSGIQRSTKIVKDNQVSNINNYQK